MGGGLRSSEGMTDLTARVGKPGAADPWHAGLRLTDSRSLASSWGTFTAEDAEDTEKIGFGIEGVP